MMRKTRVLVVLTIVFLMACAGGNKFIRDSYRGLTVSKQSYETTMQSAGDLYKQGLIDESEKADVIKYGKLYMDAHNVAVESLLTYSLADKSNEAATKKAYLKAIEDMSKRLADLIALVKPYSERK